MIISETSPQFKWDEKMKGIVVNPPKQIDLITQDNHTK